MAVKKFFKIVVGVILVVIAFTLAVLICIDSRTPLDVKDNHWLLAGIIFAAIYFVGCNLIFGEKQTGLEIIPFMTLIAIAFSSVAGHNPQKFTVYITLKAALMFIVMWFLVTEDGLKWSEHQLNRVIAEFRRIRSIGQKAT